MRSFLERKEPKELPKVKIIRHYGAVVRSFLERKEPKELPKVKITMHCGAVVRYFLLRGTLSAKLIGFAIHLLREQRLHILRLNPSKTEGLYA